MTKTLALKDPVATRSMLDASIDVAVTDLSTIITDFMMATDERFNKVEKRLDNLEANMIRLEQKVDDGFAQMNQKMDDGFASLNKKFDFLITVLASNIKLAT